MAEPVEAINLADVLKLVLQHASTCDPHGLRRHAGTWNVKDLCRLLAVSSSCRQALQQSCCKCVVNLRFWHRNLKARSNLQGFAEWVPNHTGLVSSLTWAEAARSLEEQQELQLLQRQLASALQVCHNKAGAAAATAGGNAGSQLSPLHLTSANFDHSWPEPQLVQQLGAAGLQELTVSDFELEEPTHLSPSYYSCFATLSSSLQRLDIWCDSRTMVHSADFMSAVQQLSALTSLNLGDSGVVLANAAHQLPSQLQGLTAAFAASSGGRTVISLSHLAILRRLQFSAVDLTPPRLGARRLEVLLPPNLTGLVMTTVGRVRRVSGAAALRKESVLYLVNKDVNVLAHLCSLPVLGSLTVRQSSFGTPAACRVAAAALGSATALTSLCFDRTGFADCSEIYRQLAKLPRLAELEVSDLPPQWSSSVSADRKDLLCLTALTSLTSLTLQCLGSQPDDVVAAAVASHLTGLRSLALCSDSISDLNLLSVVGSLTGLTCLWLVGGEQFVVRPDDLMLLSSLTKLRILNTPHACSWAEQWQFLAGMPHLMEQLEVGRCHGSFESCLAKACVK